MFTKLNMVDNQPVFTNLIECCHDDVISDVTVDRFPLEFRVFGTCEYYNLRSLHPMFTELDMVDIQPVLTNLSNDVMTMSSVTSQLVGFG